MRTAGPFPDGIRTVGTLLETVASSLQIGRAAWLESLDGYSRSLFLRLFLIHLLQFLLQQPLLLLLG